MQKINLRDYDSSYQSDCFIEVSDEVADVFLKFNRQEAAYRRRTYYHGAYYSLDQGDGIENDVLFPTPSPEEGRYFFTPHLCNCFLLHFRVRRRFRKQPTQKLNVCFFSAGGGTDPTFGSKGGTRGRTAGDRGD